MIWIVIFNLGTGITAYIFGSNMVTLLNADSGQQQINTLEQSFSQAGSVPVEEQSFWYRFLDVISLGFYNKIMNFANATIFAIPTLFVNLGILPTGLLGYANALIGLIIFLGMFELFTGKDLVNR